ncbi:mechanosensitive ion channel domain-containing protein [Dactylosporangium sp. NPDC051485]|uniref:mechanosensitive ion channel family protein n=1 Tax=Dactylosporangium sp. NPDC051485 TaxID=3154846 RepID=UPI00341CC93D
MRDSVLDTLVPLGIALAAALVALFAVHLVHKALMGAGRGSRLIRDLATRAHRPMQWFVVLCAVYFTVRASANGVSWRHTFLHADQLVIIGVGAWLAAALLVVAEEWALSRFRTDVPDNRTARRVHTQVVMIRRVTVAVAAVVALAVMLMTFPGARLFGTSVLASAGFLGIIAGLAAQSVLRNLFAGLQLAFSDAVRLGDVVIVENEWGRVQEITLSYVVVHVWDDRRLILPTSYFTEKPFQNWTRTDSALLGAVLFDVDWWLPVPEMREELRRALESTDLWDGRVSVLQVVEATGHAMQLRALVSADDAPKLWDLRCFVREHLVMWLRDAHPAALPRVRGETTSAMPLHATLTGQTTTTDGDSRVFSHSVDGRARAEAFTGPEQ